MDAQYTWMNERTNEWINKWKQYLILGEVPQQTIIFKEILIKNITTKALSFKFRYVLNRFQWASPIDLFNFVCKMSISRPCDVLILFYSNYYALMSVWIPLNVQETILLSNITWFEMGKQTSKTMRITVWWFSSSSVRVRLYVKLRSVNVSEKRKTGFRQV